MWLGLRAPEMEIDEPKGVNSLLPVSFYMLLASSPLGFTDTRPTVKAKASVFGRRLASLS